MSEHHPRGRTDPILLAEVGLALLLFALFLALYFVPAGAESVFVPRWWVWPLLAVIFFAILFLEGRRRGTKERAALREALDEARDERADRDRP